MNSRPGTTRRSIPNDLVIVQPGAASPEDRLLHRVRGTGRFVALPTTLEIALDVFDRLFDRLGRDSCG